jgi:hypothetical protein
VQSLHSNLFLVKLYDASTTSSAPHDDVAAATDEVVDTSPAPHDVAAVAALSNFDLPAAKHDPEDITATNSSIAYNEPATIKGNYPKNYGNQQPATRPSSHHAAAHHAVMCAINGKQEDQSILSGQLNVKTIKQAWKAGLAKFIHHPLKESSFNHLWTRDISPSLDSLIKSIC